MKKKLDFVTNSSSTSFMIIGEEISKGEALERDFDDVVVVAQDNYMFDCESLDDLAIYLKDYLGVDKNEMDEVNLRFFKSFFHSIQYSDCGVEIHVITSDIPKGSKIFVFPSVE